MVSVVSAAAVVLYTIFVVGLPAELPPDEDQTAEMSQERFTATDQFLVFVDGEADQGAEVFESPITLEFIVLFSGFDEVVVLDVKSSSFSTLNSSAVQRSGSTVELDDSVEAVPQGSFSVGGEGLGFDLDGRKIQLKAP